MSASGGSEIHAWDSTILCLDMCAVSLPSVAQPLSPGALRLDSSIYARDSFSCCCYVSDGRKTRHILLCKLVNHTVNSVWAISGGRTEC